MHILAFLMHHLTVGEYEYWNTFDEGAEIAANSIYIIAHGSSDPSILAEGLQMKHIIT